MIRLLASFLLCLFALNAPAPTPFIHAAAAQEVQPEAPDYDSWGDLAERAEDTIEVGSASNAALETLRDELADWRERFLDAQSINESRIQTLRSQIAALGPVPPDGETEPEDLSQRRRQLNDTLARLEAPAKTAEEAYNRADGMIREIDATIRSRQANELLEAGPSPLNLTNWPIAFSQLRHTIRDISAESMDLYDTPSYRKEAWQNLPVSLGFLVVALVLLLKGRFWMESLTLRVMNTRNVAGAAVAGFLISLGQVILPVAGSVLLVAAITSTKLVGPRGEEVVQVLPVLVLYLFAGLWLGARLFPRIDRGQTPLTLSAPRRAEGRLYAATLGLFLGLQIVLGAIANYENYESVTKGVLSFPLLIVAGLMLLRFGQFLRAQRSTLQDDEKQRTFRSSVVGFIGQAAMLLGPLGILLTMLGYDRLGPYLVFPSIKSLALLGLLVILFQLVNDIYALIFRKERSEAGDALLPILVNLFLWLAAVPFAALIWGARTADLTELWARFKEGFAFGETRVQPSDFLAFVLVFAIGYVITRAIQSVLRNTVLPKTKMDLGGQNAVKAGVGYIGIFIAAILAITAAGIDLSSLAIVAGALSVGIGFGLQNIVSNFVSGIILLVERPVKEGDWVDVNGLNGFVRDISVRSTRIETFDRSDVIIPNADLISGVVTNYTFSNLAGRVIVPVGVAYGTDTRKVEKILMEIAEDHPMVSINPPPVVLFTGFGSDSLDFEIRAILRDVNYMLSAHSDMNHEIARRFTEEGIDIPFAQRDVWLRNPEALRAPEPTGKRPASMTETTAFTQDDDVGGTDTDADGD